MSSPGFDRARPRSDGLRRWPALGWCGRQAIALRRRRWRSSWAPGNSSGTLRPARFTRRCWLRMQRHVPRRRPGPGAHEHPTHPTPRLRRCPVGLPLRGRAPQRRSAPTTSLEIVVAVLLRHGFALLLEGRHAGVDLRLVVEIILRRLRQFGAVQIFCRQLRRRTSIRSACRTRWHNAAGQIRSRRTSFESPDWR